MRQVFEDLECQGEGLEFYLLYIRDPVNVPEQGHHPMKQCSGEISSAVFVPFKSMPAPGKRIAAISKMLPCWWLGKSLMIDYSVVH